MFFIRVNGIHFSYETSTNWLNQTSLEGLSPSVWCRVMLVEQKTIQRGLQYARHLSRNLAARRSCAWKTKGVVLWNESQKVNLSHRTKDANRTMNRVMTLQVTSVQNARATLDRWEAPTRKGPGKNLRGAFETESAMRMRMKTQKNFMQKMTFIGSFGMLYLPVSYKSKIYDIQVAKQVSK